MRKLLFALSVLAAGCTFASSAPVAAAAARNYDCSKPGNANKAACKNSAKPAKTAPAPKGKETKAAAQKTTKTAQATKAAPAAKPATKPAVKQASNDRHYDCTKAGNANKAVCKGASTTPAAAKPAPAGKPAPKPAAMPKATPPQKAAPAANSAENNIAAGAIAQCKDGTYSHAKNHRGACSRHGGVAKWLG